MPTLSTISWRDIPAQVTAKEGRKKASVQLPDRFQVAIDQAASRAGKTEADDYLAEWREERSECGPDLETEAADRAAHIDETFSIAVLQGYIKNSGWAP